MNLPELKGSTDLPNFNMNLFQFKDIFLFHPFSYLFQSLLAPMSHEQCDLK